VAASNFISDDGANVAAALNSHRFPLDCSPARGPELFTAPYFPNTTEFDSLGPRALPHAAEYIQLRKEQALAALNAAGFAPDSPPKAARESREQRQPETQCDHSVVPVRTAGEMRSDTASLHPPSSRRAALVICL
jgi:hypothetical protein